MLDVETFNKFIRKANPAHQQLCVWFAVNNEYAKHQRRWNHLDTDRFKYNNFWPVVVPTLQHGWVLSTARLFDPAYNSRDKKQEKPRISLDYILLKLDDEKLSKEIRSELEKHEAVIQSLREHRNNRHA